MNLLQLQRGSKSYGPKTLFEQASFAINEGEHVGVIGPNGAGKTTLFKILVGHEALDSGSLVKANGLRIGYLEQESNWKLDQTSEEFLQSNCITPIWNLKRLGMDLGLSEAQFATPMQSLSGGYRMRMQLLSLIGREPNLMLLDEPTNFLDLESILALESFLQGYGGAFLLISHDREFLKQTTDATLEVEGGDITKFPGHIEDYFEQKAQLREILEAQSANQEAKRKSVQSFIDRFGAKASKARQAQSRRKQLEKMEKVEIKDLPVRAKIKIPEPMHTGKESMQVIGANLGYGENVILTNVNLRLERGTHLGVVGVNGAGKSTLLKSLAGVIELLSGERTLGYQVSLSYFSQHSADQLVMTETVIESLQKTAHPDLKAQEILNMAGSLLFSGDDIKKKIQVLSGGEKARVALGQILLKRSPLLLLDEPTNHLDFDTVEALTEALRDYAGTVIVVSHDRSFIGRVSTKILEIRDGYVDVFPGTYDEYVWSLQKGVLKDRPPRQPEASPLVKKYPVGTKKEIGKGEADKGPSAKEIRLARLKHLKGLEKEIAKLEADLKKQELIRDELTRQLLSAQGPQAGIYGKQLGAINKTIEASEESLLRLLEEKELKDRELKS